MKMFLYLLMSLIASSSIISAGNDTDISASTTALPNTTTLSPQLSVSPTAVQTSSGNTVSPTSHEHFTTSFTITAVSTTHLSSSPAAGTTATSGENLPSSSKDTLGHNIITGSPFTSSESYTVSTQHAVSSVVKITVDVSEHSTPAVHSIINRSEVTATPSQAPGNGLTMLAFGVMSLILILIVVMVILVTTINLRGRCRNQKPQEGVKSYDSNMTNNSEKESITLVSVRTINTDNDTDSLQVSSVRSTIVDNEDQELNRDLLNIKGGF